MRVLPCTDAHTWGSSLDEAVHTLGRGELIVMPTDTVYGVAADAFSPAAVDKLFAAKSRPRTKPAPVLIPQLLTASGLAETISDDVRALAEAFWPGALTIIVPAQPSLAWDLGQAKGTVALRVPAHDAALALLQRTGPLAVTSANTSGEPSARTITQAQEQLGEAVSLYLDAGEMTDSAASTIVDATGERARIVRQGAISDAEIAAVVELADPDAPVSPENSTDSAEGQ